MSKIKLIPPDRNQCQTLKPEGNFMTFGGCTDRMVRCSNKPVVIAYEKRAAAGGQKGSMSLCEDCKLALIKQLGKDFAKFVKI